jgi:Fic family protein
MSVTNWLSNMIYSSPQLAQGDLDALSLVAEQRERLRHYSQHSPNRWNGSLRRAMFAKAIQGSNSIEGIQADIDTAVAAIQQEPPLDERKETWMAIDGYRSAMTYIMQAAQDQYFEFSKQFLKSLHFMIANYRMANQPGQWRAGSVFVVNSKTGETVYDPPPPEQVDQLVTELVEFLKDGPEVPALVRAAMAHLNLTMIHPFKDGNGRVSRALQTLVIARDGILHPVFCSIEEWLGDNTQEYYDILAQTGQDKWNPQRDALPWVRFCIKGHYQQAAKLIRRNEEAAKLYAGIMQMIEREKLPDRVWMPLFDTALGLRVTNSRYRSDANITDYTASRDLKRLSECGLLAPHGEKRSRRYTAAKPIADLRAATRINRPLENPYDLVARKQKLPVHEEELRLPGL